jgi:hypothetical protein
MKAICTNCQRESGSAARHPRGLCTGCAYLPEKRRSEKRPLTAGERAALLARKARNVKVGATVTLRGEKLLRVDGRTGNHNRWNYPAQQLELIGDD